MSETKKTKIVDSSENEYAAENITVEPIPPVGVGKSIRIRKFSGFIPNYDSGVPENYVILRVKENSSDLGKILACGAKSFDMHNVAEIEGNGSRFIQFEFVNNAKVPAKMYLWPVITEEEK